MTLKRWIKLNRIYLLLVVLIAAFGLMDAYQIKAFHKLDSETAWILYNQYTGPAIWMLWFTVLIVVGIIWYIVSKDRSEAIALSVGSGLLLWMGLEDIFFFMFSPEKMTACMAWFGFPQNIVSTYLLGETCVSPLGLILNVMLGVFVSYRLFNYLKRAKW